MKIAVIGAGYVGLSVAVMLAKKNRVEIVDILPEKVDAVNKKNSPIRDPLIEKWFQSEKLNLKASMDVERACTDSELIILALPTNYDSEKNYFDTSAVENSLMVIQEQNPDACVVIKSTV